MSQKPYVFVFANVKGGVSKTTSATHCSMALARRGRTLAIDHDPQGDLSNAFLPNEPLEYFDNANTFTVIRGETTLKESTRNVYEVDILPSSMELEDFQYHVGKDIWVVTKLNTVFKIKLRFCHNRHSWIRLVRTSLGSFIRRRRNNPGKPFKVGYSNGKKNL
ncbi:hypothetical protein LBBP_04476 (plasmid) [Leptospira borgpetersenii serovar Ballum]|uniref:AAA domain-containing protein n=1 Tax=Leptospira borgpetersenii serovar Ballum TaxID=280505 RepID=A0A0S2IY43_LEPBO|nr:hypothetical protein LBBP_04476 [Leptospira borgpetersenii serovar Ballum]